MDAFTVHTGLAVPLRRSNVDTDQIVPAEYLKRVTRTGFADGLFASWRADPAFVLNQPRYAGASILIAGPDFGTGSSREHAVWALQDYGFRVVIAPRFGDIFRGNALKAGLLPVVLDDDAVDALQQRAEEAELMLTVDLASQTISGGGVAEVFEIDGHARWRLLNGFDDIALTMQRSADLAGYEARRPAWLPRTL